MNHLSSLKQIILERRKLLEAYAQKANANVIYINRENQLIQSLTEIYNEFSLLKHQDLWKSIENNWKNLENSDANFSGIQIQLRTHPEGLLCNLPVNLYENGI